METNNSTGLDNILDALFIPYMERVPDVGIITKAMIQHDVIQHQSDIINDHIAFRTLGVSNLGIESFEKIFMHYGYEKRDYYYFEGKKLDAFWYAPPAPRYPRIFISELRVVELSDNAQRIISKYTKHITTDPVDSLNLGNPEAVGAFFYNPLWDLPTLEDYKELLEESEYAAWVIYNRYYLNHYTISVHKLPASYNTVEKFNNFLESIGIILNTSGGKVKVSKDGLLRQSSTVARMIEADFADAAKAKIAGSYVEFAERLPLPGFDKDEYLGDKHRRDGFESANADKIFESTYNEQTKKLQ